LDNLYSLYDALISINVPNDRARAVVDAMERDMSNQLATKADLQLLSKDIQSLEARLNHTMDLLGSRLTLKLGGLMVVLIGLLYTLLHNS
jgi:hypothetical protein